MGIRLTKQLVITAAVTGAMIGAAAPPAFAAHAATPTISINVKTRYGVGSFPLVIYGAGTGRIFGSVTSAAPGEEVRLYSRQFPYKKPFAQLGAPVTISQAGTVSYSFGKLAPSLATRYKVELFASSSATTPLASSAVKIIYVIVHYSNSSTFRCPRPDCKVVVHATVTVPGQAMRGERAKKIYTYFAVRLSPTRIPPAPKVLVLGAGHPRVSRTRRVAAGEYAFSITFTFRIGNNGAHWGYAFCIKDTVTKDGLGLPGHHDCGAARIPARFGYLG